MAATTSHPHRSRLWGRRHLVVGRARLPSYVVLLYAGCVAGTWAGVATAASTGLPGVRVAVALVALVVPALVGARLWYVLGHLDAFRRAPARIWRREEGGSALYGGLILAMATSVPLLAVLDLSYWPFWDAATITMAVGLLCTRVGCAMNGCCAGRPTDGRLGVWMPDRAGTWARRIPSPLLEAGWVLALLVATAVVGSDLPFAGARCTAVLALYVAGRALIGTTRASSPRARRANLVVSLSLLGIVAVAALVLA